MNSRKRKGQLESMIGKIFVLSLFLILLVNLIVPNKEKSRRRKQDAGDETESVGSVDHFRRLHETMGKVCKRSVFRTELLEEDKSKRR